MERKGLGEAMWISKEGLKHYGQGVEGDSDDLIIGVQCFSYPATLISKHT